LFFERILICLADRCFYPLKDKRNLSTSLFPMWNSTELAPIRFLFFDKKKLVTASTYHKRKIFLRSETLFQYAVQPEPKFSCN
jgi:hypothetical protein